MKLANLTKAIKLNERLATLNKEIHQIELLAKKLVEGRNKTVLVINSVDLDKKAEKLSEVKFDADGSLVYPNEDSDDCSYSSLFSPFGMVQIRTSPKEKALTSIRGDFEVNDMTALEVLGVLILCKQHEKAEILKKLARLGIQ
ncbi:hypothetical protein [Larkinella terrae]|uniref:Uncharacterized protein n=1 Tax=Larkinella terrae TaxID=2025311 RepID=A0A7K0EJV1_9BACT|nr:hypothetical protein [Larkinella terrae]MRS61746.1 hypothetical protein [Larkinella terrae]